MGKAEWGADPEFFGPRHAHREGRILDCLRRVAPGGGLHLECAAGVGSLSFSLADEGRLVVAADSSMRSLGVIADRARRRGIGDRVLPVIADITNLPFRDATFSSATTAETLEHIADHERAAAELARVLVGGGWLVGTVPASRSQWSVWDEWAGHLRRYDPAEMNRILSGAGLEPDITVWGWPFLRLYDAVSLRNVNRRRLKSSGAIDDDPTLRSVARLGKRRWMVTVVQKLFDLDRVFDGSPWGVGLLLAGRKPSSTV